MFYTLQDFKAGQRKFPRSCFHHIFVAFKMSMITATAWVPRGFAAPFPTKYTFDEEFKRISELAKLQLEDAKDDLKEAQHGAKAVKVGKDDDTMSDGEGSDGEDDDKVVHSKAYVS